MPHMFVPVLGLADPNAALPVTLFGVATGLAVITTIVDLIAIRRRRQAGHARVAVGILSRATDLLLPLLIQLGIAGLTLIALLATTPPSVVLWLSAMALSGSVIVLITLGAWLGINNQRRARRGIIAAPPPRLMTPPAAPDDRYRAIARPGVAEQAAHVMLLLISLVFALDFIPWILAQTSGNFPTSGLDVVETLFLIFGAIGVGFLLAALLTLDQRRILIADTHALHFRMGVLRRTVPWAQVRQIFVRDHGDGRWSYRVVSADGHAVMWFDTSQTEARHVTTSAMAALVAQRSGVAPTWLDPQQTDQQVRQSIQASADQIEQRTKKLIK